MNFQVHIDCLRFETRVFERGTGFVFPLKPFGRKTGKLEDSVKTYTAHTAAPKAENRYNMALYR